MQILQRRNSLRILLLAPFDEPFSLLLCTASNFHTLLHNALDNIPCIPSILYVHTLIILTRRSLFFFFLEGTMTLKGDRPPHTGMHN